MLHSPPSLKSNSLESHVIGSAGKKQSELSIWQANSRVPSPSAACGLAQSTFHGHPGITEELLRTQLYPEVPPEEFRPFLQKMRGLLKSIASADMDFNQLEAFLTAQTKKQGGITSDQAGVISKFWKNHKTKIKESLINQSRWENSLKTMNWRVDLKSQSKHLDQINAPVAIVELELGKSGQESECLCLEFDEVKLNQILKKLTEVEDSISTLTNPV